MHRRKFITQSAITSIGFLSLAQCTLKSRGTKSSKEILGLVTDPLGYLDLPTGFSYKVISKAGSTMSDGLILPGSPDGMGAFLNKRNEIVIIRNHENSPESLELGPFGKENELLDSLDMAKVFDTGYSRFPGLGGTTSIIFDEEKQEVKSEFLSLSGTYRNCAGGPTPWNSWMTCEEDVNKVDGKISEQDHGFVFDVPADATGLIEAKPILGMGRFNHEAVAVDPDSGIIYQTEDRHDGLIYRFIPDNPENLHDGGKLQALKIDGSPSFDTRNWKERLIQVNQKMEVNWIDLDDVLSAEDDLRMRGFEAGAARFARGEGMWYAENQIYFACTNGGPKNFGQIFKLDLSSQSLELFAESNDKTVLHMCDNLTISPWGDALICEDNGELNRMHLIDLKGNIKLFGVNRSSESELTGAVFSPSGKTLFVNIQASGETVAITGPWDKLQS